MLSCTMIIYVNYLNLENSLPNMVCMGIRNRRTPIPAKHDGPISAHSKPTTAAAWRGPIHKKCRKIVTFKWEWNTHNLIPDQYRTHQLDKPLILSVRFIELCRNFQSWTVYTVKIKSTLQFSLTMTCPSLMSKPFLSNHPRTGQNIERHSEVIHVAFTPSCHLTDSACVLFALTFFPCMLKIKVKLVKLVSTKIATKDIEKLHVCVAFTDGSVICV